MKERQYWLGFSVFPGIGPARFAKLLSYFGSAENAWSSSVEEVKKSKIGDRLAEEFGVFRQKFNAEHYEESLQKKHVWYVTLEDKAYPQLLKQIKNPPFVLYVRGTFDFNSATNQQTIGIVGTRMVTDYGRHVTELFTQELVDVGCVIVSGLALGVDTIAHQTTLNTQGKTIAVLGCGVDCCFPKENEILYKNILGKEGVIVSEYAPGTPPSKGSFPSRNRIIAGLSLGVLVTEGAAQSGSLITANDAFINRRSVFAVPGPINSSLSSGPYKLIQQGAKLVTNAQAIISELGIKKSKLDESNCIIRGDTEEEQRIIDLLSRENVHFDELVRRTHIDASQLGGVLSLLEMKGMIKSLDGGFFALENIT